MPTNNLHQSPTELPVQDTSGVPVQDNFNDNIESGNSIIDDRWANNGLGNQANLLNDSFAAAEFFNDYIGMVGYGQQYGLEPQYANMNGYFNELSNAKAVELLILDKNKTECSSGDNQEKHYEKKETIKV